MRPLPLALVTKLGLARGQEFLDPVWRGMHAPARWRCLACGDVHTQFSRVVLHQTKRGNNGCPRCRTLGNLARQDQLRRERVEALLAGRGGGRCVDGLPVASDQRVRWQCSNQDHPPFHATLDDLSLRGRWCPRCTGLDRAGESYGEAICRTVLEQVFDREFLRCDLPGIGEIDCYEATIKVGCEHQGAQHDHYIPYFHATPEGFLKQQQHDAQKAVNSRAQGIYFVAVPAVPTKLKPTEVQSYLVAELRRQGCPHLPPDAETRPVDLSRIYRPDPHGRFANLRSEAAALDLALDEQNWMGPSHRYGWRCLICDDRFERSATSFFSRRRKGHRQGCRACSERLAHATSRKDFAGLVAAAASHGITVVTSADDLYARSDARCTLRCMPCLDAGWSVGESTWVVGRHALLGGRYGCARCAHKGVLTREEVCARVERRGWHLVDLPAGRLNNKVKVTVRCTHKHLFSKVIHALGAGGCPKCYNEGGRRRRPSPRLSPEIAGDLALKAGWVMSEPGSYRNTKTALNYRCVRCEFAITTSHAQVLHRRCRRCHPAGTGKRRGRGAGGSRGPGATA